MQRTPFRSLLATVTTVLLTAGLGAIPAQADSSRQVSERAAAGSFTWDGTWRTNVRDDVTLHYTPESMQSSPQGDGTGPGILKPAEVKIHWTETATREPGGGNLRAGQSGAYGQIYERDAARDYPQVAYLRFEASPGGTELLGEWSQKVEPTGVYVFKATCVDGPCLKNTASPTEIKQAESDEQAAKARPETSKIRGLENVRKPARSKYAFKAYKGVNATFQCRFNKQAWKSCASKYVLKTKRIRTGKHILRVRAVSPAGLVDRTPSKKFITVRPKR